MKNLHFYLDGKSCLLRAKKLLSNCYHLCFEDDYTRKKLGSSYMDILLDEQGDIVRGFTATDHTSLLHNTDPEQDQFLRDIWNAVKRYLLPEACMSS